MVSFLYPKNQHESNAGSFKHTQILNDLGRKRKPAFLCAQGFLKVNFFNLLLLLMARGWTKDGLCITGVYSPHPSNSPPRCLRDESQFILLREAELYHQYFASILVWMTFTVFGKS